MNEIFFPIRKRNDEKRREREDTRQVIFGKTPDS